MTKRQGRRRVKTAPEAAEAPRDEVAATAEPAEPVEAESAVAETLRQELDELQDRHLRLAAEYDNYRKRIVRERADMRSRIQAELARMMLDAVDDLTRVTVVDRATVNAADVIAGVGLVERKLLKELEGIGLTRIGRIGEGFDPNTAEAVGAVPAPTPEQDGTVADVVQLGYQLGDILVRPARVRVYVAPSGDASEGSPLGE